MSVESLVSSSSSASYRDLYHDSLEGDVAS